MLRYDEQEGSIQPGRLESGYPEYDDSRAQLVHRICQLSDSGLQLDLIKQFVDSAEYV
jgi:DNA-binding transcriptional MerR regulator